MPKRAPVSGCRYRKLRVAICRSHAFCEPHAWYMNIGRWVIALSGKVARLRLLALERFVPDRQRIEIASPRARDAPAAAAPRRGPARRGGTSAAFPNTAAARSARRWRRNRSAAPIRGNRGWPSCNSARAPAVPRARNRCCRCSVELVGIRRALAVLRAVLAAPAGEQADARRALVADDVVGVVAIDRRAVGVHHARQSESRAEVEQHRLETAHVARDPPVAPAVAGSNTGWRIASATPSASEIGRSSSEIASKRSR